MSWARLDDGFWMNPKVLMAGNTAAGVFARMLSYCGHHLTDGLVPIEVVAAIVAGDRRVIEKLEQVGLIQVLPTGSIFIPAYLEYNHSKAKVEADREKNKENGRKGGRPRNGVQA